MATSVANGDRSRTRFRERCCLPTSVKPAGGYRHHPARGLVHGWRCTRHRMIVFFYPSFCWLRAAYLRLPFSQRSGAHHPVQAPADSARHSGWPTPRWSHRSVGSRLVTAWLCGPGGRSMALGDPVPGAELCARVAGLRGDPKAEVRECVAEIVDELARPERTFVGAVKLG
jgi:hypothetical protein